MCGRQTGNYGVDFDAALQIVTPFTIHVQCCLNAWAFLRSLMCQSHPDAPPEHKTACVAIDKHQSCKLTACGLLVRTSQQALRLSIGCVWVIGHDVIVCFVTFLLAATHAATP
jgi:hypothetical protein